MVFRLRREQHELTAAEEAIVEAIRRDVAHQWPDVSFTVAAARVMERNGVVMEPEPDKRFGIGYRNGPVVEEMREVVAGRTHIVARGATIGAVLWLSDQRDLRDRLRSSGRRAIVGLDLTPTPIASEITANDAWAVARGAEPLAASEEEGWEILFWAQRVARASQVVWPSNRQNDPWRRFVP